MNKIVTVLALALSASAYANTSEIVSTQDQDNELAFSEQLTADSVVDASDEVGVDADASGDASANAMHGHHHRHRNHCKFKAWKAAKPSAAQNKAAHDYLVAAKDAVKKNIPNVRAAAQAMHAAWKTQPVDRDTVLAAEQAFEAAIAPVKDTVRDTRIEIINLLTADQRKAFDRALHKCLRSKHCHHHH